MGSHLERLFTYDAWANRQALAMLNTHPEAGQRARRIFA